MSEILKYLEDQGNWNHWLMEGTPTPHRAAAILPIWLSHLELSESREETRFWTQRASIFYINAQWANHAIYSKWGQPAEYLPWKSFLRHLTELPTEKKFLFFAGKFRTLPTSAHTDTVVIGRMWNNSDWHDSGTALIFEPKENIEKMEGERLVFDPRIRSWAYSLLPVDIVTSYPPMQDGENADSFYSDRNAEIRAAFSGIIGAGIGSSPYKERAAQRYKSNGIEVVDTTTTYPGKKTILHYDTSELDRISANSDLIEKLILSFLRHTGQIKA